MCYYDPKKLFLENINMGNQKTQNIMLISNSCRLHQMPLKKATAKKLCILSIFVFVHFFMVLCFLLLLEAFLKAGIHEFEISIKFCVFYNHIDIFHEKFVLGHNSTFCKMFENVQFFSHLHLKYAKSAIMTQTIFFLKIAMWVSKKRRILC